MIAATVVKSTFTGSLVQYTVRTASGLELLVERHKPAREDLIAANTAVSVHVPLEAVLVFDPDSGARL